MRDMTALTLDPTTKGEIWLFQKIGSLPSGPAGSGKPLYRRLPYNLVVYDGDPTEYLEPAQAGNFALAFDVNSTRFQGDPIDPRTDGSNRVIGVRYFDARPFEVFGINDVDASGIGQLP